MEVIDFKDIMKEEKFVPIPKADEQITASQSKTFTRDVSIAIIGCLLITVAYFSFRSGGASEEGSRTYSGVIEQIFSDAKNSYPNLKSATCTEKNPARKDCIAFTFVFYPVDDPATIGTAMSPVDIAEGLSDTDLKNLKLTMQKMVEMKHQYIYERRAPLSVLILSSNVGRNGILEEKKMECKEVGNDVECGFVR